MRPAPHPFATGGGGTRFEYRVATLLVTDLLRGRFTEHDGVVEALGLQSGPPGFDDIEIRLQLIDGGHRTVYTQCRHRQPFSARDEKYAQLLTQARGILESDAESFASGERRLAIVVDHASPGCESMRDLCALARSCENFTDFEHSVAAHGGSVRRRWDHALGVSASIDARALWETLAFLEVRAVDIDAETSRDYVEVINRLSEAWSTSNMRGAVNCANAIYAHVAEVGSRGGIVDIDTLKRHLKRLLPPHLDASTRRSRLYRRREAGEARVEASLRAIGVEEPLSRTLCSRIFELSPTCTKEAGITVITGPMGVGKTTELERLHRAAIDRAIADPRAPIPLFLDAREVRDTPLTTAVANQVQGIGDPNAVGIHLIIDGLDEAGLTVDDLGRRIATLLGEWPCSTVVLATRPQSQQSRLPTVDVNPLSEESAIELIKAVDAGAHQWIPRRAEIAELLRRPLFAIRYALDRASGRATATHEAQLVDSVGQHAAAGLAPTEGTFELLVELARRILDAGGTPVPMRTIGATPPQINQAIRSRVLHVLDGRATFQLAVLTEWFAATALLREPEELERTLATPQQAWRWRYAHVQALLQGSATDVDAIMSTLLSKSPATAAWVLQEAEAPFGDNRDQPPTLSAVEAGQRVRVAAGAWRKPWPDIARRWVVDGAMPTLGVAMQGPRLTTAWRRSRGDPAETVVDLPAGVRPFDPPSEWVGTRSGTPRVGETWPWGWTLPSIQREIDAWIEEGSPLGDIEVCWPELAWTFAHSVIGRDATTRAEPVPRATLDERIASLRSEFPTGEVIIGGARRGWRLTEGEAFSKDLARRGVESVASPWPAANTRGGWTWLWWTADQLVRRLNLATKAALDAYKALVERHMPAMAPYLSTFQMLPARISGTLIAADAQGGWEGEPRYVWHLEPLPSDAQNEAHWRIAETVAETDERTWERRALAIRELRPETADLIHVVEHHGEPEILSPTPASSLALSLLVEDLRAYRWTNARVSRDEPLLIRPRYDLSS